MTKYFLIGGYPKKGSRGGKDFCQAFLLDLPENASVLICSFAREKNEWQNSCEEMAKFFTQHVPQKNFHFVNADIENFSEQVQASRAIFFRGGDEKKLLACLQENTSWQNFLENKNIAGTSAGSDVLSQYYYDITENNIKEGLGLVKVKVIPHFESSEYTVDWQDAQSQLKNFHEELPAWCLREGEYAVFEDA